ncbi:CinA family protein [Paraburkholderia sp. J41]|uniref:CinA family protein n=1 Tax=Paraburkholderia sp. J41 TaxID=2805433 RepID=UPI002AC33206|nr:CinA family protein [Paraburkholderia sp. J41]
MNVSKQIAGYLMSRSLVLVNVETATGGAIGMMLAEHAGARRCLDLGYVAYTQAAFAALPGVRMPTLARHGAVSEAVAREAAQGALAQRAAPAQGACVALACIGVLPDDEEPGAVVTATHCFAWACIHDGRVHCASETLTFSGKPHAIRRSIARRALLGVPRFLAGVGGASGA